MSKEKAQTKKEEQGSIPQGMRSAQVNLSVQQAGLPERLSCNDFKIPGPHQLADGEILESALGKGAVPEESAFLTDPSKIFGVQPPSESWIPVMSAPLGTSITFISAGAAVGVNIHYLDGRSQPCTGAFMACGGCFYQRSRWRAYMPCFQLTGKKAVVELTLGAVRAAKVMMTPEFSGTYFRIRRKGPRRNGPVIVEMVPERDRTTGVPWFDVQPVLLKMWEIPDRSKKT